MATHDYSIANQSFPATRSDINNALAAIQSSNSGSTAPTSTVAGELFYDTTANQLKVAVNTTGTFVPASVDSSGDLSISGDLTVVGTISSTSDITLKTGIRNVPNALDKIAGLNGVQFSWRSNGQPSAGIIAQEVEKVLPEAVIKNAKGAEDYLTVNYNALHSLYIEAIKELKDLVDAQSQEIELLKKG